MTSFDIAIPYFQSLKSPDGWHRSPDSTYGFDVVRFHFFFKRRADAGRLYSGAPIADISVPPGVTREDAETWSKEIERTDVAATARSMITELECTESLANEIKASATASTLPGLDVSTLAEATRRFRQEASEQISSSRSITTKTQWSQTEKFTVDGSKSEGPLYVVSQYRQVGYDVYLSFVDFLFVEYELRHWWQRRRRTKSPRCEPENDWKFRSNVIRPINAPLKTIRIWELADVRNPIVQGDYTPDVGDPSEVLVEPLTGEGPTYPFATSSDVKSLYNYANTAFPYKWTRGLSNGDNKAHR